MSSHTRGERRGEAGRGAGRPGPHLRAIRRGFRGAIPPDLRAGTGRPARVAWRPALAMPRGHESLYGATFQELLDATESL